MRRKTKKILKTFLVVAATLEEVTAQVGNTNPPRPHLALLKTLLLGCFRQAARSASRELRLPRVLQAERQPFVKSALSWRTLNCQRSVTVWLLEEHGMAGGTGTCPQQELPWLQKPYGAALRQSHGTHFHQTSAADGRHGYLQRGRGKQERIVAHGERM